MKLRKIVFWLHLVAGLVAGVVVLIMSVTGILLAYERQMTEWADRSVRIIPPAPNAMRLPVDQLLAGVRAAEPRAAISGLTLSSDRRVSAEINLGRERTIFVNPYTGAVLGDGSKNARAFFHWATDVHRWLGASDKNRAVGRAITGACNLAFLFLVVSGFYLWWPRQWTKNALRAVVIPSAKLRGKARDFNWHNSAGFWSAPILFFLVLSGVFLSYPWATNLLYRATGSEPPAPFSGPRRGGRPPAREALPANLEQLWSLAEKQVPDWQSIGVRFGGAPNELAFSIDRGNHDRPDLRSRLTVNPATGAVVSWEPFSSYNLGRQLRTWSRFVHTGEAFGVIGQTLAALACAAASLLVWTGFALAWRRFRGRASR